MVSGLSLDLRVGTGEAQKGKGHCWSSTAVFLWLGGHGEPAGCRAGRKLWPLGGERMGQGGRQ